MSSVQFVPFRKYRSDPRRLAREVLYELPRQFIEYAKLADWQPQVPEFDDAPENDFVHGTLPEQPDIDWGKV